MSRSGALDEGPRRGNSLAAACCRPPALFLGVRPLLRLTLWSLRDPGEAGTGAPALKRPLAPARRGPARPRNWGWGAVSQARTWGPQPRPGLFREAQSENEF